MKFTGKVECILLRATSSLLFSSAIHHTPTSFREVGFPSNDSTVAVPVCLAILAWVCPGN